MPSFNFTSGTNSTQQFLNGGETGRVAFGATLNVTTSNAVFINPAVNGVFNGSWAVPTFDNAGTVSGLLDTVYVETPFAGTVYIRNTGTILSLSANAILSFSDAGGSIVVDNAGTITSGGMRTVELGGGNDTVIIRVGSSTSGDVNGMGGTDALDYGGWEGAGVTVHLAAFTATGLASISQFENVSGSAQGDSITGDQGVNSLFGDAGNDTLEGGAGNNTLDGGADLDTASYAGAGAGVTVSLAVATSQNTGGAGTDTLSNVENLAGSGFADTLTGDAGANTLSGGAGNDVLDGGAGNDTLNGGADLDTASYAGAGAGVTVSLAVATSQNTGGAGTDTLSSFENLAGSAFADTLTGDTGANTLSGGAGNDVLAAAAGNDALLGGTGIDVATVAGLRAAATLTKNAGAGWTVTGAAGTDGLLSIERLRFDDVTVDLAVARPHDLTGRAFADLLWTSASGLYLWQQEGAETVGRGGGLGGVGAGWTLAGRGDLSGDGRADLVWQNGSGELWGQLPGGTNGSIGTLAAGQSLSGVGDTDGDGKADLVLVNAGAVTIRRMDGTATLSTTATTAGGQPMAALGDPWSLAAVADFNGDLKADLLWRNGTTGDLYLWQMDGSVASVQAGLGRFGAAWTVAGAADLDGDGRADVVLRDAATGDVWGLLVNAAGTGVASQGAIGRAGAGWDLRLVADVTGDDKADLLWTGAANDLMLWQMDGLALSAQTAAGSGGAGWALL
ncbi:MAG: FG-GAP-like repeat-containing protein [Acetobacteraceae bacterium]|nr:FG-GAP-like repeat-containing protein [Acetobacteraceae bacterium]